MTIARVIGKFFFDGTGKLLGIFFERALAHVSLRGKRLV
jgi:hypothetical protein